MSNADLFVAKLNRLKTALGVSKDKEAGDLLGLKEQAFNARKSRGSFPEKELRALAQQRPDLGIDVELVLTGQSTQAAAAQMVLNMGARFREVRGTRSADEFAALLGTTPQTIAAIEAQTQPPTSELVKKLIKTHPDKDVMWLLGGKATTLEQVGGALSPQEIILIGNYRNASKEGKAALGHLAAFYATHNGIE